MHDDAPSLDRAAQARAAALAALAAANSQRLYPGASLDEWAARQRAIIAAAEDTLHRAGVRLDDPACRLGYRGRHRLDDRYTRRPPSG